MGVLLVLFWIWCGVSVVVLVTRPFIRRARSGPGAAAATARMAASLGEAPEQAPTAAAAGAPETTSSVTPASPPHAPTAPAPAERPASPSRPVADATSPDTATATDHSVLTRSRSVADALAGIRLPCGLAPLVGLESRPDPRHVVFVTDGLAPEVVGREVGDELERLGCELSPIGDTRLQADRGADALEVEIHPDAATVEVGGRPVFPTAPEGSVVVEFRLL